LIQRFGRINRKRSKETIGHYKPIYVLAPPNEKNDAFPYELEVLNQTFAVLPNNDLLNEIHAQKLIDKVYFNNDFVNIDLMSIFKDGNWMIKELWHNSKSALLETLDIDSVACIDEADKDIYNTSPYEEQARMEIPVSYRSVAYRGLDKSDKGSKPFVIPSKAYDNALGFLVEFAKPEFYNSSSQLL
jgi:CRISPR-associated endonuclease/helicase Cas3